MLPDQPALKAELAKRFIDEFRARVNSHLGAFGESPRVIVKEGKRLSTKREDGSQDDTEFRLASGSFSFSFDEVPDLTQHEIGIRQDAAAREMAEQIAKHGLETLNAAIEKTGNTVKGNGEGISTDLYLEMLRKIQMDFGEDGRPSLPTIMIHPSSETEVRAVIEQIHNDPVVRHEFELIITQKRMDWRAREAARKLVG